MSYRLVDSLLADTRWNSWVLSSISCPLAYIYNYVPTFRYLYFFFFLFFRILSLSPLKNCTENIKELVFAWRRVEMPPKRTCPELHSKSHSPCSPILVPISQAVTKFCLLVQSVRYMHIPWPPGFPAAPSSAPEALLKLVQDVRRSGTQETHLCH